MVCVEKCSTKLYGLRAIVQFVKRAKVMIASLRSAALLALLNCTALSMMLFAAEHFAFRA